MFEGHSEHWKCSIRKELWKWAVVRIIRCYECAYNAIELNIYSLAWSFYIDKNAISYSNLLVLGALKMTSFSVECSFFSKVFGASLHILVSCHKSEANQDHKSKTGKSFKVLELLTAFLGNSAN